MSVEECSVVEKIVEGNYYPPLYFDVLKLSERLGEE